MTSLHLLWLLVMLTPIYAFLILTPENGLTNKKIHLNKYDYKTDDANKGRKRKQDWNKYYYETIDNKKESKVNDASKVSKGAVLTEQNKSSNNDDIREIIHDDLAIDKESLSGMTDEEKPSEANNKKTDIDPKYLEEVIGNFSDSKGEKENTLPSDGNVDEKDDSSQYMDAFRDPMNSNTDNSKTPNSDEEDTSYDDEIEIDDSTKYLDAFGDVMNSMNSTTPSTANKAPSDDNEINENDSTKYLDAFGDLMSSTDNYNLKTPYSSKTEATYTIGNGKHDSKPPPSGTKETSGISENRKDDSITDVDVFGPPHVNDEDIENPKTPSSDKVDPYAHISDALRDILKKYTDETTTVAPSIGEDEPTVQKEIENNTDQYFGGRYSNSSPTIPRGCGYSFPERNNKNYASRGEFPWIVAIFRAPWNAPKFQGGGVLIHPSVVLTAAHIVFAIPAFEIRVRAGEVAIFREDAQYVQERIAKKIVQHEDYYRPTMEYAASLVFLQSPFDMSSRTVGVACLPRNSPAPNTLCYGTGWGQKDQYDLNLSAVLKKIPLPIVDRKSCQAMYRKSHLSFFRSHPTHLCAGGLKNVDTCDGDGGAPLVCPLEEPHRFESAGLAAFSVGCGQENVPGSYVNLGQMRGWVDDTMRDEGLEETYNY